MVKSKMLNSMKKVWRGESVSPIASVLGPGMLKGNCGLHKFKKIYPRW